MTIKVAIVEDNKALRESIIALFSINEGFKMVGSFSNANSIVKDIISSKPDVVLMDIQMPGINGIEAVKLLRAEFPEMKIVIQTVFEDDDSIFQAICNGASGYILKRSSPAEYMQAIIEAYNGGAPITGSIAAKVLNMFKISQQSNVTTDFNLSEREKEVLNHLVKGLSYKMIADKCGISYDTVRFHMKNIYSKLHVESMTEAVSVAIKNKIV
ncbi:MAG: response regulator transcription factor [Bacteroidetes bacterium]|nr:response regulator transcription factor [Bacteroidota bacterium]